MQESFRSVLSIYVRPPHQELARLQPRICLWKNEKLPCSISSFPPAGLSLLKPENQGRMICSESSDPWVGFLVLLTAERFENKPSHRRPGWIAVLQHICTVVGSFLPELGTCHAFLEKLSAALLATLILDKGDGMKCTFESKPRGRAQYLAFLSQRSHLCWHWFKDVRTGLRGWIGYFISYRSPFSLINNWMHALKARAWAGWWKEVPEKPGWGFTEDQI